jgi:hypothetical protein
MDVLGGVSGAGVVLWYEHGGRPETDRWRRHVIDLTRRPARPEHGEPVDLDGDGDVDVVMALRAVGRVDPNYHQLVWYENVGEPGDGSRWRKHVVRSGLIGVNEAVAADLDRDGDVDVVATAFGAGGEGGEVAWFENLGDPRASWRMHSLKKPWERAAVVIVADLDGNGWPDVSAANELGLEFRWWQNKGIKGSED